MNRHHLPIQLPQPPVVQLKAITAATSHLAPEEQRAAHEAAGGPPVLPVTLIQVGHAIMSQDRG